MNLLKILHLHWNQDLGVSILTQTQVFKRHKPFKEDRKVIENLPSTTVNRKG